MKKRTTIIGSIMAATMFLSIGIGTTLALYTSEKTVNVHLISGSLGAELYMTEMVRDELDNSGLWIKDKNVDLTGYQGYDSDVGGVNLSVFSGFIFEDIKIVPTMEGSATFKIFNKGDVAFNYTVSITYGEYDEELKDQVTINYPTSGGQVLKGDSAEFEVGYKFRDELDNNDAMDQSIKFDIVVLCTQVTRPTN